MPLKTSLSTLLFYKINDATKDIKAKSKLKFKNNFRIMLGQIQYSSRLRTFIYLSYYYAALKLTVEFESLIR